MNPPASVSTSSVGVAAKSSVNALASAPDKVGFSDGWVQCDNHFIFDA